MTLSVPASQTLSAQSVAMSVAIHNTLAVHGEMAMRQRVTRSYGVTKVTPTPNGVSLVNVSPIGYNSYYNN